MKEYFIGKNSKFYYSDDNWETYEESISLKSGYEQNTSSDIKYSVILRQHLGEARAKVILGEFDLIRKLITLPGDDHSGNGYGDEFEVFALSVLHNLTYKKCIDNNIVRGSKDGKIDAIILVKDEVYIYQIKLTDFSGTDKQIMRDNYEEFMRNNRIDKPNTKDLENFLNLHKNEFKLKNQHYKAIARSRNADINIDTLYDLFFETKLLPEKNNNLELFLELPRRSLTENGQSEIVFNYSFHDNTYIFIMSAKTLINKILEIEGIDREKDNLIKLFFDNVRGFLGVNPDIVETLESEPENFLNYSNGITITGDVEDRGMIIKINNPMIGNGQQTLYTLMERKDLLNNVNVLVMVKGESDPQIKMNIARNTNNQKPIKPIDMLSLHNGIRNIQKELFLNAIQNKDVPNQKTITTGFYLNIYQNGKKGYESMLNDIFESDRIIQIRDFLRLYFGVETKKIGDWKSNLNYHINKVLTDKNKIFEMKLSLQVCNTILIYNEGMSYVYDKQIFNDMKSSDLTLQYLICTEDFDFCKALKVVYYLNYLNRRNHSKIIDLHKSNNVINEVEKIVSSKDYELFDYPNMIQNYHSIRDNQIGYANYLMSHYELKQSSTKTYIAAISQIETLIYKKLETEFKLFENHECQEEFINIILSSDLPDSSKRKLKNAYSYLLEYYALINNKETVTS